MLRSTILSVMLLEGAPDPGRFERVLARSVERVPRLRQRVVLDPLGAAPPRWERDAHFDLGYHVRRVSVAGEGTLRDLLDLAQPIAMQAFDKDRPLWELYQVAGLEDGRSALADQAPPRGVGRRRARAHDREPRRALARASSRAPGRSPVDPRGARRPQRVRRGALRAPLPRRRKPRADDAGGGRAGRAARSAALRDPLGAARDAGRTARSVARMLRPVTEPLSR